LALRPTKSARRFALSSESAVFQVVVVCLPSHLTRRQTFTLDINAVTFRLAIRTWLPSLVLPPFQTKTVFSRDSLPSVSAWTPTSLVRPSSSSYKPPSRRCTSLTSLGLAICRAVTDLTSVLLPPLLS